jgi:hypothetical protein
MEKLNQVTKSIGKYWPLLVVVLTAALGALALMYSIEQGLHAWMHFFSGIFLCQFAMLKLFNLSQFADGFQKYDVVAQNFRTYAYVYPLIELVLGLAYLAFIVPQLTYIITLMVMAIGAVSVVRALKTGLNVKCACMGTVLDVPLSTVTLAEDLAICILYGLQLSPIDLLRKRSIF